MMNLDTLIAESYTPCQGWRDANKPGIDTAWEVAAWLTARGYLDTRPVCVTIRRGRKVDTFFGAFYYDSKDEGRTFPRFYLIGKIPAHLLDTRISRKDRIIWTFGGVEVYTACYADPSRPIKEEYREANPHGHTFVLCSTTPGSVDQYEPRRKRVPLDILFI